MWCGNFAVIGQLDSVWTVFLVSNILKFSVKFVKSDTNNIQNVKIQNFFRKGFAREFLSAFFSFRKLFFKQNFFIQQRKFKALNFISRRDSVSDVVSEISFLSQVRNLFSQSSRNWIQTLFSRTFRSGFSFYLITQNRGIYFEAWFLMPYHITEKVFAKGGLNWTKSSISTERSKLLFQITKLTKK